MSFVESPRPGLPARTVLRRACADFSPGPSSGGGKGSSLGGFTFLMTGAVHAAPRWRAAGVVVVRPGQDGRQHDGFIIQSFMK